MAKNNFAAEVTCDPGEGWLDNMSKSIVAFMMTSQILKSMDFTKTKKYRYLENETMLFLQIKKFTDYTSRATLWQKYFCSRGNL